MKRVFLQKKWLYPEEVLSVGERTPERQRTLTPDIHVAS